MSHDDKIEEAALNGRLVLKPGKQKPDTSVEEKIYRNARREDLATLALFILCILVIVGRMLL